MATNKGFGSMLGRLNDRTTVRDALDRYRSTHGRGASKALAAELGVSQRQAQRYLKGDVRKPPATKGTAIIKTVPPAARQADQLRRAQMVGAGALPVVARSPNASDGPRRVGTRMLSAEARADLAAAAELLEAGD